MYFFGLFGRKSRFEVFSAGLESQKGRPALHGLPSWCLPTASHGGAQPVSHGMSLSPAALTLAGACHHMSEGP